MVDKEKQRERKGCTVASLCFPHAFAMLPQAFAMLYHSVCPSHDFCTFAIPSPCPCYALLCFCGAPTMLLPCLCRAFYASPMLFLIFPRVSAWPLLLFPMPLLCFWHAFLWCCYAFPMLPLWCCCLLMVLLCIPNAFSMVFLWYCYAIPTLILCFPYASPMVLLCCCYYFPTLFVRTY